MLAHLHPAEYEMLWPDIAVKNNPKSGWHGRERHESMAWELRHCGERHAYSWHTSSTRVFPSLFLCAPLYALWCRLIKTSLTRSPKEDLVPVAIWAQTAWIPPLETSRSLALCWTERLCRRHRFAQEAKRGSSIDGHGVLCSLRTVKGSHFSLSASQRAHPCLANLRSNSTSLLKGSLFLPKVWCLQK